MLATGCEARGRVRGVHPGPPACVAESTISDRRYVKIVEAAYRSCLGAHGWVRSKMVHGDGQAFRGLESHEPIAADLVPEQDWNDPTRMSVDRAYCGSPRTRTQDCNRR
jgi:hypothetical protein